MIKLKKIISVLGSTGSIGTQTLEVARESGVKISALAVKKNISLLELQIREFRPKIAAVFDERAAKDLRQNIKDTNTKVVCKMDGLCEAACQNDAESVITAVSGMIGLKPTLEAINSKKDICLANKETLVAGGKLVMNAAKKSGVSILPVDSEHSAIFQCMQACTDKKHIKKLVLTASGGPFFGKTIAQLNNVNAKDALNHPNWKMGAKITIDSATMMNKGLEIIEAVHLFDIPESMIEVTVHRESVIHSMIEFCDNSVLAQMGMPNMKTPIRYALTHPERLPSFDKPLNLAKIKNLSFFEPDNQTFEAMNICRKAVASGDCASIILNAANEEAVNLFLRGKIKFLDIISIVKFAIISVPRRQISSIKDIICVDNATRDFILNSYQKL